MRQQLRRRARRAATVAVIVCVAASGLLLLFGGNLGAGELAAIALASVLAGVVSARRTAG